MIERLDTIVMWGVGAIFIASAIAWGVRLAG